MFTQTPTPKSLGFRMPAEWEKHEATWLAWPHNAETFLNLPAVENAYVEFIRAIALGEKARILVLNQAVKARAEKKLGKADVNLENVEFYEISVVDGWLRDTAPTFVTNNMEKAMVAWEFNAWGNKYEDLARDNGLWKKINEATKLRVFEPGIVLEGGSFDANGAGALLTTSQCLLNKNRNPHLTQEKIEEIVQEYLGLEQVIWLGEGIEGDDTDGHIDDLTRFVSKNTVVTAVEENKKDANYSPLAQNLELLKQTRIGGRGLEVVELPMPSPLYLDKKRLPASHLNFYICNASVIVPTFGGESDEIVMRELKKVFSSRKVIGVDCKDVVIGFGAVHCLTQQEPHVQ